MPLTFNCYGIQNFVHCHLQYNISRFCVQSRYYRNSHPDQGCTTRVQPGKIYKPQKWQDNHHTTLSILMLNFSYSFHLSSKKKCMYIKYLTFKWQTVFTFSWLEYNLRIKFQIWSTLKASLMKMRLFSFSSKIVAGEPFVSVIMKTGLLYRALFMGCAVHVQKWWPTSCSDVIYVWGPFL